MGQPHRRTMRNIFSWMSGPAPEFGNVRIISHDRDIFRNQNPEPLVSLLPEPDSLTAWVRYHLIQLYHDVLGWRILVTYIPFVKREIESINMSRAGSKLHPQPPRRAYLPRQTHRPVHETCHSNASLRSTCCLDFRAAFHRQPNRTAGHCAGHVGGFCAVHGVDDDGEDA